ncbi:MAG: hypothetical protein GX601_16885 [Anaerolineales bacterium]|nr:hypothetical protein [Anaerolineales bacterium]
MTLSLGTLYVPPGLPSTDPHGQGEVAPPAQAPDLVLAAANPVALLPESPKRRYRRLLRALPVRSRLARPQCRRRLAWPVEEPQGQPQAYDPVTAPAGLKQGAARDPLAPPVQPLDEAAQAGRRQA